MTEKGSLPAENKSSMKNTIDKKDNDIKKKSVSREFEINIPGSEIEKSFELAAEKYSAEMKMDGFRKGRIPVDVVKSKYREIIIDEVINKLIEDHTFKTIKDEKIPVISAPVIKKFDYKEGKDLNAQVLVDLMPEVVLPDLDKLEVKIRKDILKMEDFNEDQQIELILENNKTKKNVNGRNIKEDDFVEFTIQSQFRDTKRMMQKKDLFFEVKDEVHPEIGDLYKDFLNKASGDKLELERTYTNDYKKKNWAGKTILHSIQIKAVSEQKKPEFNEEFLKTAGFSDEKSFKSKLREEYDNQLKRHRDQIINTEIRNKLIEVCDFPVPDSIIDQEMQRTQSQYNQIIMTLPKDKREEYINSIRENAEKSIKFSFILEEIKKRNSIKVEKVDLEKEYETIAGINNIDIKDVRKYYSNNDQKEALRDSIGRNRAVDFLKEKIRIKEV